MAKFNMKSLVEKHTDDDSKVDWTKVNEELDTQNKNIVAKAVEKETKKFDKDTVINEFLKENDFKSLDDFSAFKKNGATADTEAVKRLEKELEDLGVKYKELLPLQGEVNTYKNQTLLRSKGNLTQDQLEFYEYKINKLDGDTFEEKYNTFVEGNPDVFVESSTKPNVITTGTKVGTKVTGQKAGWEEILEEKFPDLKD